jgi:nucleotide-binding universal stress UspA family protein
MIPGFTDRRRADTTADYIISIERSRMFHSTSHAFGVLAAVTDDSLAPAVASVARALQERRSAVPSILYVIEIGPSMPEAALVAATLEEQLRNPAMCAKQKAAMRSVLNLNFGAAAAWPISIEVGSVAATVVEQARRQHAELVVMGLNRHAVVSRMMGKDSAREVMTLGGVPVLAIRQSLTELPKRVVVAMDFSRASIRAACLARRLIDDQGTLHLLFVESGVPDSTAESAEGLRLIQEKGVASAFSDVVAELMPSGGLTIDTVVRRGNPSAEILRFCEDIKPDLIAVGSQRHRFLDRLLLGSVARSVAADGRWSVLVTPPGEAPRP